MIGGVEDHRILLQSSLPKSVEHHSDAVIRPLGAGEILGKIMPGLGSVGDGSGRHRGVLIDRGIHLHREGTVGAVHAVGEEERLSSFPFLEPPGHDLGVFHVPVVELLLGVALGGEGQLLIIADDLPVGFLGVQVPARLVLNAAQGGVIAAAAQELGQVLGVVDGEAPLGQAQHPILMGVPAGEQSRPAGGAGGAHAVAVLKGEGRAGELLQVGGGDLGSEGREDPAAVVGVQIQKIQVSQPFRIKMGEVQAVWPLRCHTRRRYWQSPSTG